MTFYVEEEISLFGELTDMVNAEGQRQTAEGPRRTKLTDTVNEGAGRFCVVALTRSVIEAVVGSEGCPHEVQLNILLTDEATIQSLNKDTRGVDAVTDVLSFPACPFTAAADFHNLADNAGCFDLGSKELILGDIVICVPILLEQARAYGHSIKREYAFLLCHSLFHLLGYDHADANAAGIMEKKQEAVLGKLGIGR